MRSREFTAKDNPSEATELIYRDEETMVTVTLVKINDRSYPVNAIGALYITKPDLWKFIVVASVFAVVAFQTYRANDDRALTIVCLVVAAIVALVGLLQPYALIVRTNSSDHHVLRSRQVRYLQKIMEAIEIAVQRRG